MGSKRPRALVATGNQDALTSPQRATAHLWGQCGWLVEQLAQLFGVSDRTIKRDLRAGRAAGVVPRKAKRSSASILQQARFLLTTCAGLRESITAAFGDVRSGDTGILWAALQARLLAEERKVLALIAGLPGADRVRLAEEVELPEYIDPDLLKAATERAREAQ